MRKQKSNVSLVLKGRMSKRGADRAAMFYIAALIFHDLVKVLVVIARFVFFYSL